MRILIALGMILAATFARADQGSQRMIPGMSLTLQGELLDINAPICSAAAGSYSVSYRNSIATGCAGRGSDDFATLLFTGSSPATYTMPQSSVTTFTGSISGTTLTTPTNAVTIGSVITGVGVLDNTYVTAGSGTSWTVNNSQTVPSRTLTQSIYPPGHGTCFKSDTSATALLTVAATISTISGAAGVSGASIPVNPGGEVCLQATVSNNYLALGYLPGVSVSSFTLVGHTSCVGATGCTTAGLSTSGANLFVINATWNNSASNTITISDSSSNSYTSAVKSAATTGTDTVIAQQFYVYAPTTNAGTTFTATSVTNGDVSLQVQAWSGAVSSPLDQTLSNVTNSGPPIAPGSITPTQAGELIVSGLVYDLGTGLSVNSGFTISDRNDTSAGVNFSGGMAYLVQGAAAAVNPTFSWTTTGGAAAVIGSYR